MRCFFRAVLLLGSLAITSDSLAQSDRRDVQSWINVTAIVPIGAATDVKVDGLVQLTDDVSRTGREFVRGVIRRRIHDRVMMGGGYVWTHVDPGEGPSFTEHRIVEQIDVSLPLDKNGFALASRTQVEQRFRGGEDRMSLRMRQLTRLDVPLDGRGMKAVAWNEYFHELRNTRWSGPSGSSLMLNFAGMHFPVSRHLSIEPGYLNQTGFDAGRNRVAHVAALYVIIRP